MPKFIDFVSKPFTKAKSLLSHLPPLVQTAEAGSTVEVEGIMFSGPSANYNPLYDRQPRAGYPSGSNIEPPQWQRSPAKDEPISYTRNKTATVKLDITGTYGTPIWVKVTPTGELTSDSTSISFTPSSKTIEVTDWDDEDYNSLTFTSSALPNEVRLDNLSITWDFEYGYSQNGPWNDAGDQTISHEIYITYDRPYYLFSPFYRPWKRVLRDASSYADGATSTIQTSSMVTSGIYNSLAFDYVGEDSHSAYDNSQIELWSMRAQGWMDCMDGSNYYTIMMRWLGISANQIKIDESVPDTFDYKELRPISTSSNLNAGWQTGNWNFHQVGILTNVYDPITMVDKTGTPRVPTNMTKPVYSGYVFDAGEFVWASNALVTSVK